MAHLPTILEELDQAHAETGDIRSLYSAAAGLIRGLMIEVEVYQGRARRAEDRIMKMQGEANGRS